MNIYIVKLRSYVALLFVFSVQLIFGQNIDGKGNITSAELEKNAHLKSSLRGFSTATGVSFDVKYDRCEWQVDPNVYAIAGKVTSYIVPVVSSLNTLDFDLHAPLVVDSIYYHNSIVSFTHANDVLQIILPFSISQGVLDSVSIYYHGAPHSSGFGSFAAEKHLNDPVLWTLSQPNGSSNWWPCKESLNDKIDSFDVIVTAPSAYKVASNGLLISEFQNGANTVSHWQSHYPITTYLIAIAVSNYKIYSDSLLLKNGDILPVIDYLYPEDSLEIINTRKVKNIITLFDSLIIPYPFSKEKYGHAQFGWGGGMEHQTMSFMGVFYFSIVAHELAHQWFGDYITCGSWKDVWLNEGFASYFEGLAQENLQPASQWAAWKSNALNSIISSPDGSVYCADTIDANRIFSSRLTYNKGSYLVHMLRWKMGDSLFFAAIKNYLKDTKLIGGYARTADLKYHLETTSGLDLTKFFAQWFYGQGFPTYHVNFRYNGGPSTLTLTQTTSHNSVAFFEMPVPIRFQNATHDTTIIFDHKFSGELYKFNLNFKPVFVTVDPELWLISTNNTVNYQVLGDENPAFENDDRMTVFPNPNVGLLHLDAEALLGIFHVRILNILGEELYITTRNSSKASDLSFDFSFLSNGIYIMEVLNQNQSKSIKIIKN